MKIINRKSGFIKAFLSMLFLGCSFLIMAQAEFAGKDTIQQPQAQINVAYGIQNPDAVTGSISTVRIDDLKGVPTSFGQAYNGRLPGLVWSYIRGIDTQGGPPQPLVIVDGFKSSLEFLSFNEVESISILKDAVATALYGMEAANGVILITTRSGKVGKRNITVDVGYTASVLDKTADLLNSFEYANLRNQAVKNDNFYNEPGSYELPFADPQKYGDGSDPYSYPDNNYLKEIFNPVSSSYNAGLRVDGGLRSLRYMFSGYYSGSGGTFNKDLTDEARASTQNYSNNIILRGNVETDITKNFMVSANVKFALLSNNSPAIYPVNDALILPPTEFPVYNPDGSLGASVQNPQRNPLGQLGYSGRQTYLKRGVEMNLKARYSFDDWIKGLSFEVRGAMDSWFRLVDTHSTMIPSYIYNPEDSTYTLSIDQQDLGVVSWNGAPYNNNQRRTMESSLNYSRIFNDKHSVNLMLLSHFDQYDLSYDYYKFKNLGYGVRAAYGYADRYFAEFTGGYYGQEAFKEGHNFGFFPAVGLAWIVSKEGFMENLKDRINYLKIRGSYGMVGGTGFSDPDLNRYYSAGIGSGTSSFGYYLNDRIYYNQYFNSAASSRTFGKIGGDVFSVGSGAALAQLASIVSWDKSYKRDVSLEATLFDRFNVMFNYFHDTREDFLTRSVTNIPYLSGVYNRVPYNNAGKVDNKGFEASLEYYGEMTDISYSLKGAIWYNNSIITSQASINESNPTVSYAGNNISQMYGYETAGFYPVDTPEGTNQGFGEVLPGDIIYVDQNNDGIINVLDLIPIGKPWPTLYSLSIYCSYKGFFLDAMITGNFNGSRHLSGFEMPFDQPFQNAYSYAKDSWTPETAETAKFPRLSNIHNTNNSQPSDLWVRSTDRLDVTYIQLGYDVPETINTLGGKARIYLQALNPLSILKYDDRAYTSNPWYRHYSVGMNIKF